MAKPRKLPLPDRQYVDKIIDRLQQNKGNSFKLPDGTIRQGYLLEHHEFEQLLFVLMRLSSYVDKKRPGPKRYETLWEAYCAEPALRQYLEEEKNYVNAYGKERGKRAFALKVVAGDKPHKIEPLGKQIDKWLKLPTKRGE